MIEERRGRVLIITLQGETSLNLGVMNQEFYACLDRYLKDDELRCAIVTGAGDKAFCAGSDVKQVSSAGFNWNFWSPAPRTFLTGEPFWKPLIAAVNGYALGAGMMLAMGCDIRIASDNASFGLPEIKLGFPPALGATQRLPRLMAMGPALEILMTGEAITASQAERWGFVNAVVRREDLLQTALKVAERIAANPPQSVHLTKELAVRSRDLTLEQGIRLEDAMSQLGRDTQDAREGLRAFEEKRPPDFKGK
jgi:E-phenylitaconyl-CoA hydratase